MGTGGGRSVFLLSYRIGDSCSRFLSFVQKISVIAAALLHKKIKSISGKVFFFVIVVSVALKPRRALKVYTQMQIR